MTSLPHEILEKQLDEISEMCKKTGEPIFLTKNGKKDLVIMSIESYEKSIAVLKLKERLLDIEIEQSINNKFYSVDELDSSLKILFPNK